LIVINIEGYEKGGAKKIAAELHELLKKYKDIELQPLKEYFEK
jgi:hypothetical protein